jgi:phage/plasmid-like protein (TIGR03299 family)
MAQMIDAHEQRILIPAFMKEGRDTYAGRLDAWHQMGQVSGVFQTLAAITLAAGANFQVLKKQLDWAGVKVAAWGTFRKDAGVVKGLEQKQIRVKDSAEVVSYLTFLASVGEGYTVIPHQSAGELLDSLVANIGGAHYETMGTLDFGRRVWAQVNPNYQIRVGEDVTDVYLSYLTSHDGTTATEVYETGTRQVCRNTVRIGRLNKLSNTLRLKHTKNANKKMTDWKMELAEIKDTAVRMQDKFVFLAGKKVTRESLDKIMLKLFPVKKDEEGKETDSSTRRTNILADILSLYEKNDGDTFPEQRGTAYALLNSITNYTDHVRSSKGGARAESALFGSGDKMKTSALEMILEEAEEMPNMKIGYGRGVSQADMVLQVGADGKVTL